jgi:hypothetical protein
VSNKSAKPAIVMMPVADLVPYARNPRKNDGAVDAVASSIKEFGFQQPIVVDPEHVIVVGHTRYLAAQKLKLTEVPVIVAEGLSPAQLKAYRIADNRAHEFAAWDSDLLKLEVAELAEAGFDLDLTLLDLDALQDAGPGEPEEGDAGPLSFTAQYNIVFDDQGQQDEWFKFVKWLKGTYGDLDTIGARLQAFIRANGYGAQ